MNSILRPWPPGLLTLAGCDNCEQQHVTECVITENQVFEEKLGKKRILLNDVQRRRLAVKGKGGNARHNGHALARGFTEICIPKEGRWSLAGQALDRLQDRIRDAATSVWAASE